MSTKTDYDLCIIGGGAAGLVTAAGAAALGAKVLLIEQHRLGGDCLYTGCVPSKTLLHCANVAQTIKTAGNFSVNAELGTINQQSIMQHIAEVISQIEPHDSPERFRAMGIEIIFASAKFIANDCLIVNDRQIRARKFVLATGSRPFIPAIPGLDKIRYFSNETIFDLDGNIDHLIIIGSGAIACEIGQSFARLGSKVTIVSDSALLATEDRDMAAVVQQQFIAEGINLQLNNTISHIESADKVVSVFIEADTLIEIKGSHLLIASGRQPNIESLALDKAGVATNNKQLVIDARLRTSNKNIYACGDVAGPYLFTHMAEYQAGIVLKNALFHWPAKMKTTAIPWCIFSSPELARVGLSQDEAEKQGIKHCVYSFPFSQIDRAITDGNTQGRAKIITSPKGKLLGACIVGPHAGELIAEYCLAISQGLNVLALSNTIHIYPTLAQINRRVADLRMKELLTPARKKWIKRLFTLRGRS